MLAHNSSAAVALTTGYAALKVTGIPDNFRGGLASLVLTSVVTAVSVTWYLSSDLAGDEPITPVRTDTILGQTSGKGGVACSLENAAMATYNTTKRLWVQAKLNAGTATGTARISWEQ